jgi:hypothetical protein
MGVKGDKKSAKQGTNAKLKKWAYHVQSDNDFQHWGVKKVATGYTTGKHNGVIEEAVCP